MKWEEDDVVWGTFKLTQEIIYSTGILVFLGGGWASEQCRRCQIRAAAAAAPVVVLNSLLALICN